MPLVQIQSADDPRLSAYHQLKERELARDGGRFIAEGEHLVRRLLLSSYRTESVLLADRRADEIAPLVSPEIPVYVAAADVLNTIVGFKFHSGVLGCGFRGPRKTLDEVLPKDRDHLLVVICPDLANTENLGSIIRVAAGFGADALVLGPHSADPFFRRCVRVSMGTVFRLPIVQSDNLAHDLARLKQEWGVSLTATVLEEDAQPLASAAREPKMGLLFGNEAQGLDSETIAMCDHRVTIPMRLGTDSLNITVADGIFLYHYCR